MRYKLRNPLCAGPWYERVPSFDPGWGVGSSLWYAYKILIVSFWKSNTKELEPNILVRLID
jgi:hypothetical protein